MATHSRHMVAPQAPEALRFLTQEQVRQVRRKFGTPVFVYDELTLERQSRSMLAFPNAFGLTVRYSIKAGATGAVMRIFDRLGLAFDASSGWEAMRVIAAGIEPSKVLLTAQELPENLGELIERGVEVTASSLAQLDAYGRRYRGTEVSIRLNPGEGTGAVKRLTSGGPRSSFGIWHESIPEAVGLIERYHLRVKRVHQHIGSGHDPRAWARISTATLEQSRAFGSVPIINLGGGYRVKSFASDPEVDYGEIGESVKAAFVAFAGKAGTRPRLEIEPGTYLTANAGSLVTSVIDVVSTGASGYAFVKIDSGLTEVMRPGFYGAPHPLVAVSADATERPEPKWYLVAGHCCIAGDLLTTEPGSPEEVRPQLIGEVRPGDLLVVERAGGYCSSMNMKNFNSFPEAPEVLLRKNGAFELIRRRQTLEQITANEIMPGDLK